MQSRPGFLFRRVASGCLFEAAFFEERFDEGDDGALILRREVGDFAEPSEESRGARTGDVVAHRLSVGPRLPAAPLLARGPVTPSNTSVGTPKIAASRGAKATGRQSHRSTTAASQELPEVGGYGRRSEEALPVKRLGRRSFWTHRGIPSSLSSATRRASMLSSLQRWVLESFALTHAITSGEL